MCALVAAVVDVAMHWSVLPARVPTHFDALGNANGWGGKGMLLVLLGTTVMVAVVMTVAESYQRLINIPVDVDRESPEVRRLLRSMVIVLKAVIAVAFAWISDVTMRTALGEARGLGGWFLPVFLLGVLGPVVYYVVRVRRV